jgi:aerobic carbon-monoxide dehydrogenase medium subunit
MKPPPFHYARCASAAEAVALLSEAGDDAKLLAGGQSLVPLLNFRLARPTLLIDISRLHDLAFIRQNAEGSLCVGALSPQATLETTELGSGWEAIAQALPHIGHYPTRIRGTVGGSVAHADPAAEIPLLCVGFGALLTIVGPHDQRSVEADGFFLGPFTTLIAPDEMLTEIRLMPPPLGASTAFAEFSERHGNFALVSVLAGLLLTDGICSWVRVAAGGLGPMPIRSSAAEAALAGSRASDSDLLRAADAVASSCSAADDFHCSAATRRDLAREITFRALMRARSSQLAAAERRPAPNVGQQTDNAASGRGNDIVQSEDRGTCR